MAWAPSTNFEDDLVDLQPDFNLIHGQLAYEAKRKQDFIPRPKSTYDYLAKREERNAEIEKHRSVKSKEISASLAMMERIQAIAGTKPLGEHATMSDWDDKSTVEKEAIAMMRHFGMMSMTDGSLSPARTESVPDGNIHVMRNGRHRMPLILDPKFFEPGKKRQTNSSKNQKKKDSRSNDSVYSTPDSHLDDAESNQDDKSYVEIPYQLLVDIQETESCKINKANTHMKIPKK
ncbi:uncharacterized protein LOC108658309 [Drosophila navojoa]|uniref:uncharacterized protein LOC108658309 n=1 Tax=Drosophila navojoa TaxID=7232 RepID=UPI000847C9C0|nr:uncharacterized protein LOC108658309 [Drosophila navojoa]